MRGFLSSCSGRPGELARGWISGGEPRMTINTVRTENPGKSYASTWLAHFFSLSAIISCLGDLCPIATGSKSL